MKYVFCYQFLWVGPYESLFWHLTRQLVDGDTGHPELYEKNEETNNAAVQVLMCSLPRIFSLMKQPNAEVLVLTEIWQHKK